VHRWIAGALTLAGLVGLVCLGIALADDPAPSLAPANPGPIAKAVEAGKHIRIDGPRGPIHVWIPPSYHADTGATIIYVHGYFDDADTAWTGHQLPEQFALSALNAVFIVPEAPTTIRVPINYPDLGELLRIVEERTGAMRGAALTAAIGHSGAFRTLQTWLDEPLLDQIVMVDAMYGEEQPFLTWFNGSPRRRLISVGNDTVLGTESLASKIPETVILDRFPPTWETMPPAANAARHLYIRSQYAHMPLVMDGIALPQLLRLLPVELLADEPWQQPLGSIPPLPDASTIPLTDGGTD
jgi:hypothetical protein